MSDSTRAKVLELCGLWRRGSKRIAFSSGAFDILHAGHVSYLEQAKKLADKLVVAINSDASVRRLKGWPRPIIPEQQRLQLVRSLRFVDAAYLFDEENNKENILALKPDIYIKAADYSPQKLGSAKFLPLGAKVVIIRLQTEKNAKKTHEQKISSSAIIDKILVSSLRQGHLPLCEAEKEMQFLPTVFLDRDGVINKEIDYLHKAEDLVIYPEVFPALQKLRDLGFQFIIITNQPGIGLGYFTKEDFFRLNLAIFKQLQEHGIHMARVYYCPHTLAESCQCRKPGSLLFKRAFNEAGALRAKSVFIGDRTSDIEAAKRAGIKSILVKTGKAGKDGAFKVLPDVTCNTLLEAVPWIENEVL